MNEERDILSKINEQLTIANHYKETEILKFKDYSRPSDDYRYIVEMNISLENKLKSYETEINMLKLQISQKNEEIQKIE